ncbi:transcriptional regulator [Bordetella avium]|nr:transcriptional regulator [Bordetella avium]
MGQHCPHCGQFATVRTSEAASPLVRVLYFQCRDLTCGHTWVSHLEIVRTITPAALPNPNLNIPLSTRTEIINQRLASQGDQRQLRLDHDE